MNTADGKTPWQMWVPCAVHPGLCLYLLCSCPPHIPQLTPARSQMDFVQTRGQPGSNQPKDAMASVG